MHFVVVDKVFIHLNLTFVSTAALDFQALTPGAGGGVFIKCKITINDHV